MPAEDIFHDEYYDDYCESGEAILKKIAEKRDFKRIHRKEKIKDYAAGIAGSAIILCAFTAVVGFFVFLTWGIVSVLSSDSSSGGHSDKHYQTDFSKFCREMGGAPLYQDATLCLQKTPSGDKLLFAGSDASNDNRYNDDFATVCKLRGGQPTVGITHDRCVKDSYLIMLEGKY